LCFCAFCGYPGKRQPGTGFLGIVSAKPAANRNREACKDIPAYEPVRMYPNTPRTRPRLPTELTANAAAADSVRRLSASPNFGNRRAADRDE
jgi:hypothetical protein